VTIVMISVWVTIDFVPRDEANVNLEVALPPSTQVEKIGWMLGWLGTVLYSAFLSFELTFTLLINFSRSEQTRPESTNSTRLSPREASLLSQLSLLLLSSYKT